MAKKDKNLIFWIIGIAVAILLVGPQFGLFSITPIKALGEPADINKGESGAGMSLNLYDEYGYPIPIPEWFASTSGGLFAIVGRVPEPSCTVREDCPEYEINPYVGCWNNKCVLTNVNAIAIGMTVTNNPPPVVNYVNVSPTYFQIGSYAYTPKMNTSKVSLASGQSAFWKSSTFNIENTGLSPSSVLGSFINQTIKFRITVKGINEYSGQEVVLNDEISLSFLEDPIEGGLTASIGITPSYV